MKLTAVKKISAVILTIVMMFAFASNAFAETIQDRLEQSLNDIANQYESADPDTQESLQNQFSSLLEGAGLGDIDLGSLGDSDIGSIIGSLGDNLALDSVIGLFTDAFSSGMGMIQDAIGGGLGTSDGSNTATTTPSASGSPNTIIANPTPPSSTVAVGVPEANMPSTNAPVTNAPTTYVPGSTTAANLVGAGLTTAQNVNLDDLSDSGMDISSIAVIVVLSVSTIAVIVAIVIFFVLKKK